MFALVFIAACAGGPMKSKVPDGLAYDCGEMGKAYLQFGGGGYLPGQRALAKGNVWNPAQAARPRLRSTAQLTLKKDGGVYDMIAEWSEEGLRYRSEVPFKGDDYLIWSVGSDREAVIEAWSRQFAGRPLVAEDARLGLRVSADPVEDGADPFGKYTPVGEPLAICRRMGRDAASEEHGPEHGDGHHAPEAEHEGPHAP
jgi:hypothetical protein